MKKLSILLSMVLLLCGGLFAQTNFKPIPGEYIVKIKGTSIKPLILQMQDASTDREANFKNVSTLRIALKASLRKSPSATAFPNRRVYLWTLRWPCTSPMFRTTRPSG